MIKQAIMAVTSNDHVGGRVDANAAVPQLPPGGMTSCGRSEARAMAALCNINHVRPFLWVVAVVIME